jgi:hypothetical protein
VLDIFRDRVLGTICSGWLCTLILLISASRVARITGLSHLNFIFEFAYDSNTKGFHCDNHPLHYIYTAPIFFFYKEIRYYMNSNITSLALWRN